MESEKNNKAYGSTLIEKVAKELEDTETVELFTKEDFDALEDCRIYNL